MPRNLIVNTVGKHLKADSFCIQPRYNVRVLNLTYFPPSSWYIYRQRYEVCSIISRRQPQDISPRVKGETNPCKGNAPPPENRATTQPTRFLRPISPLNPLSQPAHPSILHWERRSSYSYSGFKFWFWTIFWFDIICNPDDGCMQPTVCPFHTHVLPSSAPVTWSLIQASEVSGYLL